MLIGCARVSTDWSAGSTRRQPRWGHPGRDQTGPADAIATRWRNIVEEQTSRSVNSSSTQASSAAEVINAFQDAAQCLDRDPQLILGDGQGRPESDGPLTGGEDEHPLLAKHP